MKEEQIIKISGLKKVFAKKEGLLVVFDNLNLSFCPNEITAILGPSGCGKTTLLRIIAGLDEPTDGQVVFTKQNHRLGMIFQQYTAFPWRTVEKNVAFGLELAGFSEKDKQDKINYWLDKTGLMEFRNYYPAQLSGGMKQRLAFARCLALEPNVVLLDEPFGSLDAITRRQMTDFSAHLLSSIGTTSIFVTHNIHEAIKLSDRIIVLSQMPASVKLEVSIGLRRPRTDADLWSEQSRELDQVIRSNLM